jgi:hypothetical protein
MMSCEEFTDEVGEYIEGTLPFGERIQMWLHAFLCDHCKNYLEQMRDVADLMGELGDKWREDPGGSAPDELKGDLLGSYREKFDREASD